MNIREQYSVAVESKSTILDFVSHRYQDGKQILRPKHIAPTKRGSYLDAILQLASSSPGPAAYKTQPKPNSKKKNKKTPSKDQKLSVPKDERYLTQLLKSQQGLPGVGQYLHESSQSMKLIRSPRNKKSLDEFPAFRPTCIDEYPIDCLKVGPGSYNLIKDQQKSPNRKVKSPTQEDLLTARSASLPRLPGPCHYSPLEDGTFQKLASKMSLNGNYQSTQQSKQNQQESPQEGPGLKYNHQMQWNIKSSLPHIRSSQKSVYY